jgi:DNA invertase Pin-like site-specific DNA recombinase
MFGMLGVFAEFERSIIQERVRAGPQRARSKGVRLGRARSRKMCGHIDVHQGTVLPYSEGKAFARLS